MTSPLGRIYALAIALVVFFVVWAAVAARPWATAKADPRLAALTAREHQVRRDAALVRQVVRRRWQLYRIRLAARRRAIAAAQARQRQLTAAAAAAPPAYSASPSVRVVTLPPLTITRTS